jgi:hypothetical protein
MKETSAVTEKDKALLTKYNIKIETRTVYYSKGFKYDNLKDALSYAKLDVERSRASGNSSVH